MQITIQQLIAIMPGAEKNVGRNPNWRAADGTPLDIATATMLLNRYAEECGIEEPLHWIHFLANVAVESGELRYSEENLNYSSNALLQVWPKRFTPAQAKTFAGKPEKIANYVYANRMGNGSVASGDGWRYRGRGLIGYTGKTNYQEYAKWCGYDVVRQPQLMAQRVGSFRSAAHFFSKSGCLKLSMSDDGQGIRKRINGGLTGWLQCERYIARAKQVLL